MNKSAYKFNSWLIHLAFWAVYLALPFMVRPNPTIRDVHEIERFQRWTILYSLVCFSHVPIFYFHTEILIKKILKKRGVWLYLIGIILLIAGSFYFNDILRDLIFNTHGERKTGNFLRRGPLMSGIFQILFIIAIGYIYQNVVDNLKEKELLKESENETLKSELSFLRSQISPHFMFNVLNSVVSLSRRKPEMVEPVVIKLSELMRYMLYETNDSSVPLEKEALYLESYIDLQKIRFGNDISIEFEQDMQKKGLAIEPMLLIPFVENAFKHGVGMVENPSIEIKLSSNEEGLFFSVKNKVSEGSKLEKKDDSSGIGLTNVKRRLELLHPNHLLTIKENNGEFFVSLHIKS
jgi:sensor histidine kinase YesM